MKILVLSYEYPPIGGGGGIICRHISENLAKLGNEVTVITTAPPATRNHKPQTTNHEQQTTNNKPQTTNHKQQTTNHKQQTPAIIRLPSKRRNSFQSNIFEMLSWINTTKRYIKNNPGFVDHDICMAHFVLPGGEVALWLKKKYGLSYVLISHGHEIPWVHPRQMFFLHLGAYFRIKKVCRHSEINFIQTQMMKANIDRLLGEKFRYKNVIVPNGVDTDRFCPDYAKRPQQLRILFTGRLVIQKDPMTFLKAIKLFREYTSDFEVHIPGDGNLRKRMERFVRKNRLSANVIFLGKVPEESMLEEYQAAHLMVAPSLNEGMSIAALEALSCGVYLISSRASGFEDMIEGKVNGEFVNFRDAENITEKLIELYRHKTTEQAIYDTNPLKMRETFSWKKITRQYQELLHFPFPGLDFR